MAAGGLQAAQSADFVRQAVAPEGLGSFARKVIGTTGTNAPPASGSRVMLYETAAAERTARTLCEEAIPNDLLSK